MNRVKLFLLIIALSFLILAEERMIAWVTQEAYEKNYITQLTCYRENPISYNNSHIRKYDYQEQFYHWTRNVEEDLQCMPVDASYCSPNIIQYGDSWGGERSFGGERQHEGTDIMSVSNIRGEIPIVSMTDGIVKNMGWLRLGGYRKWFIGLVIHISLCYNNLYVFILI